MGFMDEIVRSYYASAMQPVFNHLHNQMVEMQEKAQRFALSQAVMEIAYENQCIREQMDADLEESIRCWFKRNIEG
jgi:hypothetical protein